MKRHKILSLTLKEFSAVRKPAQEGATIDLTKADDHLVILQKADNMTTCTNGSCGAFMKKSAKFCPDCGLSMTKAADPAPAPAPTPTPTEKTMNEQQEKAYQTKIAFLEKFAKLTDTEKAFYSRLVGDEQAAFLEKSASQRAEELKPVYTSTATGTVFTKADDSKLIEFAKSADAQAKANKELLEKAEQTAIEARAEKELPHLPGTAAERGALLKSVEGIADEKIREGAMKALKAGNTALAKSFERQGSNGQRIQKNQDAETRLTTAVEKYAADNKIDLTKAWEQFPDTVEGQALYKEIEDAKRTSAS